MPKCQRVNAPVATWPSSHLPSSEIVFHDQNLSPLDFPGGPVVKNPPSSAEDMGLIPELEDFTFCEATKPMHPNFWVCLLQPEKTHMQQQRPSAAKHKLKKKGRTFCLKSKQTNLNPLIGNPRVSFEGFPGGTSGKDPLCQCRRHEMWVQSWGRENLLEEGMATHSSILAWKIPWTEGPDGLQCIGLQRVRHNWGDTTHACSLECGNKMFNLGPHSKH